MHYRLGLIIFLYHWILFIQTSLPFLFSHHKQAPYASFWILIMKRISNNSSSTNDGGAGAHHPACASCKHQRKRCAENCLLARYFPADRTREFQAVHKVFGVSNVIKLVGNVKAETDRKSVVESLIWEAFCRQNDPIFGPLGEYRKIQEELEVYKYQSQILNQNLSQNQLLQQGGVVQKSPAAWSTGNFGTNGINNNGTGIGGGGGGGAVNNNNNFVNYSHGHGGHMVVDSIPCGYPLPYAKAYEKTKIEKDVGSLRTPLQQHNQQFGGFNHQQQFYLSGEFESNNGKMMENPIWDED